MRDAPISRRDLLRAAGAAAAALPLGALGAACASGPSAAGRPAPASAAATPNASAAPAPAGARVPDLRRHPVSALMQQDVEGTLAQLAGMGYKEVEFAGYYGRDPKALRRTLDGLGLRAPSAHVPLEALRTALGPTLDAAATVGHQYVVCPFVMPADRNADGFRRIADTLSQAGREARARGITLGYHNHDFEFEPLPGGQLPYDLLLAGTDPSSVVMELDLYWITYAGKDPLQYIAANPGRFQLCHVKDLRRTDGGGREMADVGQGAIDFRTIFARAQFRHYFVERDNATDPLASARTSVRALQALLA